jgi:hypothetical protein
VNFIPKKYQMPIKFSLKNIEKIMVKVGKCNFYEVIRIEKIDKYDFCSSLSKIKIKKTIHFLIKTVNYFQLSAYL